jgi:hypothetical protein
VLGGFRGDEHRLDLGIGEELLGGGVCPAGTRQDKVYESDTGQYEYCLHPYSCWYSGSYSLDRGRKLSLGPLQRLGLDIRNSHELGIGIKVRNLRGSARSRGLGLSRLKFRKPAGCPASSVRDGSTWTHVSGVTLAHEPHAEDGDLDAALGLGLGGHPGYERTVRVLRCVGVSRREVEASVVDVFGAWIQTFE